MRSTTMINKFQIKLLMVIFTKVLYFHCFLFLRIDSKTSLIAVSVQISCRVWYSVGLAGTGDGNRTNTSINAINGFKIWFATDVKGLDGKNTAAVMVTGELGAFGKPGQNINVTVSTLGKAKSLRGGTLLMTPLLGADGETYAVAQGNLVVGGLGVEGGDGSSLTVNIPTVGRIPRGATIEKMVENPFINPSNVILNLHQGDCIL